MQYRELRQLYARQQDVVYALEVASFAYHVSCVAYGSLSWGDHLRMVTFRHDPGATIVTRCAFCDTVLTATHFQESCRYNRLCLLNCTHTWLLVAFWRAVLWMSSTAHPPQLRNKGDWAGLGHARQAFDYLYPGREFPAAGHWHLRPLESFPVPPALHLHLCHHISGVSMYVPDGRMAHTGTGEVICWYHSRPRLAEYTEWPRFV